MALDESCLSIITKDFMVLFHLCFCNCGCEASIDRIMDSEGGIFGHICKIVKYDY